MPDDMTPEERAAYAAAHREAAERERDAAAAIAANEAASRQAAEADAVDARIPANQARAAEREAATQRSVLSSELQYERTEAANNAFGFYLLLGVVVAALVIAGAYMWWRSDQGNASVTYAATPSAPSTVVVTPPTAPAPAPSQPPLVNVNPPSPGPPAQVHNNITVTPTAPAPPPSGQTGGAPGTGGTSAPTGGGSPPGQ